MTSTLRTSSTLQFGLGLLANIALLCRCRCGDLVELKHHPRLVLDIRYA
jgi:hypothetical protein